MELRCTTRVSLSLHKTRIHLYECKACKKDKLVQRPYSRGALIVVTKLINVRKTPNTFSFLLIDAFLAGFKSS